MNLGEQNFKSGCGQEQGQEFLMTAAKGDWKADL